MPRLVALLASFAMAGSALLGLAPPADAYVGPVSNSWYITAADLASSGGGIYSSGYNAPSGPQVVFLQAGQVCITSGGGSGFLTYGGGCQPTYNVAHAVQWWLYGFQQNPAHRGSGYVVLCVTTSNGTQYWFGGVPAANSTWTAFASKSNTARVTVGRFTTSVL